eukprot:Opistho-1_new@86600
MLFIFLRQMKTAEDFLLRKLADRQNKGLTRKLSPTNSSVDFCSNDYLGFAKSKDIKDQVEIEANNLGLLYNGSGGSRLLSGNHQYTEQTEAFIAKFHQAPAGLIFNSGYDANVGLLSSIPQRGDTIICDELIHASLIDGARLSHAERLKFKHNDLIDLEAKLKLAKGIIYVVVESVYSMDGDTAPLLQISALCKTYQANLIVDEAHATGIFGKHGEGMVQQLNIQNDIFARIVTFGKALGSHGAIILGSVSLRNYLINFARSFIYTTAAPIHHIITVNIAYQQLALGTSTNQIKQKIAFYNEQIKSLHLATIQSQSAIQTVLLNNVDEARNAALSLQNNGFDVKAILSPTVAAGKERLRICLHNYNTEQEIEHLVNLLKQL